MTDIPRCYSVGQRGYDPELARRLRISIDGQMQGKVISYDMDAGSVERYAVDDAGGIVVEYIGAEAMAKRETVYGAVTVALADG